jgi:hypothetical protein
MVSVSEVRMHALTGLPFDSVVGADQAWYSSKHAFRNRPLSEAIKGSDGWREPAVPRHGSTPNRPRFIWLSSIVDVERIAALFLALRCFIVTCP